MELTIELQQCNYLRSLTQKFTDRVALIVNQGRIEVAAGVPETPSKLRRAGIRSKGQGCTLQKWAVQCKA